MLSGTKLFQMAGCDYQISDGDETVLLLIWNLEIVTVSKVEWVAQIEINQSVIASSDEVKVFEDQFSGLNSLLGQVQFHAYSFRIF